MEWRDYIGVKWGKYPPEVRFRLEARQPTSAQAEAGEKFFGKFTTRACASPTAAGCAPNEGSEDSEEQDVGEGQRWDSS